MASIFSTVDDPLASWLKNFFLSLGRDSGAIVPLWMLIRAARIALSAVDSTASSFSSQSTLSKAKGDAMSLDLLASNLDFFCASVRATTGSHQRLTRVSLDELIEWWRLGLIWTLSSTALGVWGELGFSEGAACLRFLFFEAFTGVAFSNPCSWGA